MANEVPMSPVSRSNVSAVGYDEATAQLHVQFQGGGHYVYDNVPPTLHAAIMQSPSVGSAIAQHVKGQYTFNKV